MYNIEERSRGASSVVRSRYQQRLTGAWTRYREWERELNLPDLNWENRMAFEEWANFGRFSDIQCEMTFHTTYRQLLELIVKPEIIGSALREASKISDDLEHRKNVGKLMDAIKELGGVNKKIDGISAIAKVRIKI